MSTISLLQVQASLLRQGGQLDSLSVKLTLVSLVLLLLQQPLGFGLWQVVSLWLCIVLGLMQKYYALRVDFDAQLFSHLAAEIAQTSQSEAECGEQRLTAALAKLDQALVQQGLISCPDNTRALAPRCKGAKSLLKRQVMCLVGQLSTMLIMGMLASLALWA